MQQTSKQYFLILIITLLSFSSTNSSLLITNPEALTKILPNKINAKYSIFGDYKYGFKTSAQLIYHPDDNIKNLDKDYACKDLNELKTDIDKLPNNTISIVMVDRGSCTFVTKMRNIQAIGGKIALIVNDRLDDDRIFAMNDDGTGEDVKIPGLLITKKEGESIKNFIKNNKNATITVNIDNTIDDTKINKLNFEVNFIANDRKVYQMFNNLKKIKSTFTDNESVNFIPNYITVTHPEYNPNNFNKKLTENNNCICGGRYCSYGHNFFADSFLNTINSQDVIVESIRQKCVYNLGKNKFNDNSIYFDYMNNFSENCLNKMDVNIDCSRRVLKQLKTENNNLDKEVENCFTDSFIVDFDSHIGTSTAMKDLRHDCVSNTILENDKLNTENRIKEVLPIVFVNNHTLYGTWNENNVLEAVCANLKHKMEICYTNLGNVFDEKERDVFRLTNTQLIVFALFIILLNVLILVYCKRYMGKKAMNSFLDDAAINQKIGTIVSGYLKMKDTN